MIHLFQLTELLRDLSIQFSGLLKFVYLLSKVSIYVFIAFVFSFFGFFGFLDPFLNNKLGIFATAVFPATFAAVLEHTFREKILASIKEGFQKNGSTILRENLRKYIHGRKMESEKELMIALSYALQDAVENAMKNTKKIRYLVPPLLILLLSNLLLYPLSFLAILKYFQIGRSTEELYCALGTFALAYILQVLLFNTAISNDRGLAERKGSLITFGLWLLSSFYGFPIKIPIQGRRKIAFSIKGASVLLLFTSPLLPFLKQDKHLEGRLPALSLQVFTVMPDELTSGKFDELLGNYEYPNPSKKASSEPYRKSGGENRDSYFSILGTISCEVLSRDYCPRFSINLGSGGIFYAERHYRRIFSGAQYKSAVLEEYLEWLREVLNEITRSSGKVKVVFRSFRELELDENKSLRLANYFSIPEYQRSIEFEKCFSEELIGLLGSHSNRALLAIPHLYVKKWYLCREKEKRIKCTQGNVKIESKIKIQEMIFTLPVIRVYTLEYE